MSDAEKFREMSAPNITYYTDDIVERWSKGLDAAETLAALHEFLEEWAGIAPDAHEARPMDGKEFVVWRRGLEKERSGKFAGKPWVDRYGAILMPARMFKAALIADQCRVPWGTAWIKLREMLG